MELICTDYELGLNAFKAGDFLASSEYLQKVVRTSPEHWEARRLLALCFTRLNMHFRAQRAWQYMVECCSIEDIRQYACQQLQTTWGSANSQEP